jgi:hypothetical protein
MFKYVFILVIGISIGYFYGFDDAKKNDENVVARTVERVGGKNRGQYNNDVDKRMENLEKK